MARYERTYTGERRTTILAVKLTPSERDKLEAAARNGAMTVSEHARALLFRRAAAAAARRNPQAEALRGELRAIGINLNQIARHLNTTGDLRDWAELREALALHKQAVSRVIDL